MSLAGPLEVTDRPACSRKTSADEEGCGHEVGRAHVRGDLKPSLSREARGPIVSDMHGHSSIAITLDIYSPVIPTMHKQAAAETGALFGS